MHNPLENIPTYEYDRRWEHDGIDCHLTRGKYTANSVGTSTCRRPIPCTARRWTTWR